MVCFESIYCLHPIITKDINFLKLVQFCQKEAFLKARSGTLFYQTNTFDIKTDNFFFFLNTRNTNWETPLNTVWAFPRKNTYRMREGGHIFSILPSSAPTGWVGLIFSPANLTPNSTQLSEIAGNQ